MKSKLAKILVSLMTVLSVGALNIPVVYAEGEEEDIVSSLRMSPSATRLSLTPGVVLEDKAEGCVSSASEACVVHVQNTGKKAFNYKVYITPYVVSGSQNDLSFEDEDGTARTQISRWIKIRDSEGNYVDEATFSINPGETQAIYYQVTVPDDIPGGSQYAALWAQILNEDVGSSGIQTVGQVGSVISGNSASGTVEKIEVSDMQMTRFTFGGSLNASAKVLNTGNTDVEVDYSYVVKNFFGGERYRDEQTLAAFPDNGDYYDVKIEWAEPPLLGIFNVEFKIRAAGEESMKSGLVIVMPIVVVILMILLLTIIIVWIIIVIRKRKERNARKLV